VAGLTDIRKLLNQLAAQEEQLQGTQFLAPYVRGGRVRTRVSGLLYTFTARPAEFEGWGIFRPASPEVAELQEEALLPQVAEYLRLLQPLRLRLAHALQGQTWLAYPVNESDARQRWGTSRPVAAHLLTEGARFEQIRARWDGSAWWFEELDRRADPRTAERLREALRAVTRPEDLRLPGITPEMRAVYDLATQHAPEFAAIRRRREEETRRRHQAESRRHGDESRLQDALRVGGGSLRDFHDRGDYWLVEWTTAEGERHTSAIAKGDLTVVSAGICLSG
jgi:hypothetical protein